MPVHDWTRVSAGLFHHFHHGWTATLSNTLNSGLLPPGYLALSEQIVGGPIPDVLTLELSPSTPTSPQLGSSGLAVASAPPRARYITRSIAQRYTRKANRVAVRHESGRVVAVIEIVSPGNKDSRNALRAFVEKANSLLNEGIQLLIVDLFPPTSRDPQGIHKAIWDELQEEPFELPPDKPLTVAAYSSGLEKTAYVEPVAVGDSLPVMPLFLDAETYITLALEPTYQATWAVFPAALKPALESAS